MGTISGTPLIVDLVGSEAIKRTCERFKDPRTQLHAAVAHFLDAFDDVMVAYARLSDLVSQAHQIGLAAADDPIGPVGDEFAEYRVALRALHLAQTDLRGIRDELAETPLGDSDANYDMDTDQSSGEDPTDLEPVPADESAGEAAPVKTSPPSFFELVRQLKDDLEAAIGK